MAAALAVNAQPASTQLVDARPANAHSMDARPENAHSVDARPASAYLVNAELVSARPMNARPTGAHPGFVPAQAQGAARSLRRRNLAQAKLPRDPEIAPRPQGRASGAAGDSVLDGVFTAEQASRGEATFKRVCSACHDTGEFSGGRFRLTWVGQTTGDLFDAISTLMPEGDPGSLSPAEYAAVVAYLLSVNGYPAGEAPLPANVSALRDMEIVEAP